MHDSRRLWCWQVDGAVVSQLYLSTVAGRIQRILKGKVERTYNHQWLQASRTRATRRVGKKDTRSDSASALCEDLCMKRFSVEAAVQDPLCTRYLYKEPIGDLGRRSLVRDLKGRSLYKLSINSSRRQELCSRHQVSAQDLHKRSPGKISVQDLYKSSLCPDLFKRSLGKTFGQDFYERYLGKISL